MTPSIKLLVLRAADRERTTNFYSRLGFEFVDEQHSRGPIHSAAAIDGFVIEIYPTTDPPDQQTRVGFELNDVNSVIAAIELAGGLIVVRPSPSPWGTRAVVLDPDGRSVELYEEAVGSDVDQLPS